MFYIVKILDEYAYISINLCKYFETILYFSAIGGYLLLAGYLWILEFAKYVIYRQVLQGVTNFPDWTDYKLKFVMGHA